MYKTLTEVASILSSGKNQKKLMDKIPAYNVQFGTDAEYGVVLQLYH